MPPRGSGRGRGRVQSFIDLARYRARRRRPPPSLLRELQSRWLVSEGCVVLEQGKRRRCRHAWSSVDRPAARRAAPTASLAARTIADSQRYWYLSPGGDHVGVGGAGRAAAPGLVRAGCVPPPKPRRAPPAPANIAPDLQRRLQTPRHHTLTSVLACFFIDTRFTTPARYRR